MGVVVHEGQYTSRVCAGGRRAGRLDCQSPRAPAPTGSLDCESSGTALPAGSGPDPGSEPDGQSSRTVPEADPEDRESSGG